MSLGPGARIGIYEVGTLIGAGGMGEVYRARDTRLGRDVAVKVLPPQFARDPDRLARFQREAQVLASINHPGIATIHGLEEADGTRALVLELVEGETLADRLTRGPMPVAEALALGRQIAEAVEAAHDQGIIHRDLKPANIKVRVDGTVKVLDFGLAKLLESTAAPADATMSPTITSPALATGVGVLLGTAAYMSPEQARGKLADRRSDIWSFGCVLFEMIAGRRVFVGDDVADTLALVLRGDPDWTALPESTPPALHRLLRRMLQRTPKRRLADMADARIEIEEAQNELERPPRAHDDGAALNRLRRRSYAFGAIAVVAFLALAGVWAWLGSRPAPPPRVVRFAVPVPPGSPGAANPEISPDGRVLAFVWPSEGTLKIWVRPSEASEPRPLAGTDGVRNRIWWSPDSSAIVYVRDGRLWRVSPEGGQSEVVAELADRQAAFAGTLGSGGDMLLASTQATGGLLRLPAIGGTPVPATELDPRKNERQHVAPHFLPDGRHYLFVALANDPRENAAYVGTLNSAERHPLRGIASEVRYAPSGHLVFARDGALVAQRFDVDTLQLSGPAFPVVDPFTSTSVVGAGFSIADDGTLAYHSSAAPGNASLAWLDLKSMEMETVAPPDRYVNIELSPDEQFVMSDTGSGPTGDVRIWDLKRRQLLRVTDHQANDGVAHWGPANRVVFRSDRDGPGHLYTRVVGGMSKDELLYKSNGIKTPFDWSRDGKYIVFSEAADLWAISPDERPVKPVRITESSAIDVNAKFSPANSGLIAYQSLESGDDEIYVQSFPDPSFKRQVSTAGGSVPRWSRDGKQLFFIGGDQVMMSASIDAAGEPGVPKALFPLPAGYQPGRSYTVAGDGRFLMRIGPQRSPNPDINVILNWSSTLANRPD